MPTKKKRASFVIALVTLILGLCASLLHLLSLYTALAESFNFQEFLDFISSYISGLDFKSGETFTLIIAYFITPIGALLGLIFGKFTRFGNIINFMFFSVSLFTWILFNMTNVASGQLFDFSNTATSLNTSIFIIYIIGWLLTFVNLEKSK